MAYSNPLPQGCLLRLEPRRLRHDTGASARLRLPSPWRLLKCWFHALTNVGAAELRAGPTGRARAKLERSLELSRLDLGIHEHADARLFQPLASTAVEESARTLGPSTTSRAWPGVLRTARARRRAERAWTCSPANERDQALDQGRWDVAGELGRRPSSQSPARGRNQAARHGRANEVLGLCARPPGRAGARGRRSTRHASWRSRPEGLPSLAPVSRRRGQRPRGSTTNSEAIAGETRAALVFASLRSNTQWVAMASSPLARAGRP